MEHSMFFTSDNAAQIVKFAEFAESLDALVDAAAKGQALAIPLTSSLPPEQLKPIRDAYDKATELGRRCGLPSAAYLPSGVGGNLTTLARSPQCLEAWRALAAAARVVSEGLPWTLQKLRTFMAAAYDDGPGRRQILQSVPEMDDLKRAYGDRLFQGRTFQHSEDVDSLAGWLTDNRGRGKAEVWALAPAEVVKLLSADSSADSKADKAKKKRNTIPNNPAVLQLAKRVKRGREEGRTAIDGARDFAENNETKAQSLLRQLRRFPRLLT
jgi:hypothetical protein